MQKKEKGKWFKGNIFSSEISAKETRKLVSLHSKGVKRPIALETKQVNGQVYSRVYHKPIGQEENWD